MLGPATTTTRIWATRRRAVRRGWGWPGEQNIMGKNMEKNKYGGYIPAPPTTPRPRWRPRMAPLSSILCCRPRHWPRRPLLRPHQVRSNNFGVIEVTVSMLLAACFWKEMGRFNIGVEEALKSSLLAISCNWSVPSVTAIRAEQASCVTAIMSSWGWHRVTKPIIAGVSVLRVSNIKTQSAEASSLSFQFSPTSTRTRAQAAEAAQWSPRLSRSAAAERPCPGRLGTGGSQPRIITGQWPSTPGA